MNEFHSSFVLQYDAYCKSKNLNVPDEEQINKWKDDIIDEYSNGNVQRVSAFFVIPSNYSEKISKREYDINLDGVVLNEDEKLVIFNLTLKFK